MDKYRKHKQAIFEFLKEHPMSKCKSIVCGVVDGKIGRDLDWNQQRYNSLRPKISGLLLGMRNQGIIESKYTGDNICLYSVASKPLTVNDHCLLIATMF